MPANAFSGLSVLTRQGSLQLDSLWRERPALLFFIRRFGCIACSEWVTEVAPQISVFKGLGVDCAIIGSGSVEEASAFGDRFALLHQPVQMATDPSLATFKAGRLIQSWLGTYGLLAIWPAIRALSEGHRNRPKQGDATQLGGTFLVLPDGSIPFAHRSAHFGDNPSMPDIINAVVTAQAARLGS